MLDGVNTSNPAFGMISISRGHASGRMPLFGSSIKQRNFIQITITMAILHRDLNYDSYFPQETIVNLYLSPSQFADAITSFNTGGVPCTLEWYNGQHIPDPPFENRRIQFDDEFAKHMEETISENNKYIVEIQKILSKPSIGKKDREEIEKQLDMMRAQISSTLPFIKRQFTEQMDQTVNEAKQEFNQHIEGQLKTLGLEKLKDKLSLEFKEEDTE
jgi:hypothetical protein